LISPPIPRLIEKDLFSKSFTYSSKPLFYCGTIFYALLLFRNAQIKHFQWSFYSALIASIGLIVSHLILIFHEQRGQEYNIYWFKHGIIPGILISIILILKKILISKMKTAEIEVEKLNVKLFISQSPKTIIDKIGYIFKILFNTR
jgi:hypothetical protein